MVVFLLAFGLLGIVRNESRITASFVDGKVAYQLAEAGVEQALFALKTDLKSNRALVDALLAEAPTTFEFDSVVTDQLADIVSEGKGEVRLRCDYEPDEGNSTNDGKVGRLTIHSLGIFHTPQGFKAKRQLRVVTRVVGTDLSIVAPEHGLFIRDPRKIAYTVPGWTWDARDFAVMGGSIYFESGMACELTEYIMSKEFRPMGEVGFLDMGYDAWNFATLFSGGVNFTHSRVMEYGPHGQSITRKYFNFEGLSALFTPHPLYRPVEESYMPQVRSATRDWDDNDKINLRSAQRYKELATTVVDPKTSYNPEGRAEDWQYFTDVTFTGPLGRRNTTYWKCLPLYGWGDWRNVPPQFKPNPTRRDDISNAIKIDGITYVRGDVFLEGWYDGIGTLVVQGNVYVGGDVVGLSKYTTGYPSLMNLVVLEDPNREEYGGNRYNRRTGRVVYKPHHDMDYDSSHLNLLRNTSPFLDMAIYAQNGMAVDNTSILDTFFNMEIEFNFASEVFDWNLFPNDTRINGTDPWDLFGEEVRRQGRKAFMSPTLASEVLRFEEETPSL